MSSSASTRGTPSLSVVIVTWNSAGDVELALPALIAELRKGDELIVVDNASADGTADRVAQLAPQAELIRNDENLGFVGGVNCGAAEAEGDLLVLLNPDAQVQPGWREGIERPWLEQRGWGVWQALITSDGGSRINSEGNAIHFTGVCWAGGAGRPLSGATKVAREVGYASGACLAVPLHVWRELGGFPPRLFLYGEDVDISLLARLSGRPVGIEPSALVEHDYEFIKGPAKWRYLERSRWAFIVRCYPAALIAVLMPALLATELAITLAALRAGWIKEKVRAMVDFAKWLPALLRERRQIQSQRQISASDFADHLVADLDSDFLGPVARSAAVSSILRAYWRLATSLLGVGERALR